MFVEVIGGPAGELTKLRIDDGYCELGGQLVGMLVNLDTSGLYLPFI
jgi:hypothetical protein